MKLMLITMFILRLMLDLVSEKKVLNVGTDSLKKVIKGLGLNFQMKGKIGFRIQVFVVNEE